MSGKRGQLGTSAGIVTLGPKRKHRAREPYVKAGPVKITRADGTVEEQPALGPAALAKAKKKRRKRATGGT